MALRRTYVHLNAVQQSIVPLPPFLYAPPAESLLTTADTAAVLHAEGVSNGAPGRSGSIDADLDFAVEAAAEAAALAVTPATSPGAAAAASASAAANASADAKGASVASAQDGSFLAVLGRVAALALPLM
jgi:hypothetical protein